MFWLRVELPFSGVWAVVSGNLKVYVVLDSAE